MEYKSNSIFEAAKNILEEKTKTVKSLAVGDSVMPADTNNKKPKKLVQKIANRNNYFKLVFDDGSDSILHAGHIFTLAEESLDEAAIKATPASTSDPVWDISFDKKTVIPNLTFADIQYEVDRKVRGAKPVIDSFLMFDLKRFGAQKEVIYSAGAKGKVRVRIQLHPMNVNLLKKEVDSFGSIIK